jgi:hypothetical protein
MAPTAGLSVCGRLTLDPSSNALLAASLAEAERSAPPAVAVMLKTMATRAMTEAEYFCTGEFVSPEEFYHYGELSNTGARCGQTCVVGSVKFLQ